MSGVVKGALATRRRGRRGSDARRGFLLPNGVVVKVGLERVLPERCGAALVVVFIVEKAVEPVLLFNEPQRKESQQDQHGQATHNAAHYRSNTVRFLVRRWGIL